MQRILSLSLLLVLELGAPSQAQYRGREVVPGIPTDRIIPGEPYDLAGNRIVFTNWHYIQPGDLDWVNDEGASVYVHGDEDPNASHFVGKETPRGIRIRARKPEVIGPYDLPYRTILQDGDLYRGWTSSEYLESNDGIRWEKKADLVFDQEPDGVHHVFIDPSAPDNERFKAVWTGKLNQEEFAEFREKRPDGWEPRALLHYNETGEVSCIRGSVSPDGITWKTLPDPLTAEYSDTYITCYYDPVLEKYVMYTRYWSVGPRSAKIPSDIRRSWTGVGRRAIGRSESDTFTSFPPSDLILEPTPDMLPSEVLYTNCHTTVPGAPDQHLMFPAIWNGSLDDTTRIAMASSHNGINWHWVPGGDLLETQPFGRWDGGCIWAGPELIELPDGSWALPYSAHNVPHKYPRGQRKGALGYAVWPHGRMAALEAPDRGEFTLIPLMAPGRTLKINAVTKRTGGIRIEVVGKDARSFENCDCFFGDLQWTPIAWNGDTDLGFEEGTPITLRFQIEQGELYGLEFE
ncbi:MAG: hypothetical protein H6751_08635 [Candidatus Omnitrophica bacterium]|nr:hypothetical protein [Candidatus Omnitrophota bacterium]